MSWKIVLTYSICAHLQFQTGTQIEVSTYSNVLSVVRSVFISVGRKLMRVLAYFPPAMSKVFDNRSTATSSLQSCIAVIPAVFSVSVFCWYQICWIFGISVGIDPPLFCILPPFPPPFFQKGMELLKKGAIAPLLRKKGGTAPFLIP